jgi:transposase
MARQRRHFTPEQKVALLRLHLLEKVPVSDICENHQLAVNLFYLWQKQFFENGAAAFTQSDKRRKASQNDKDRKIAALQDKLRTDSASFRLKCITSATASPPRMSTGTDSGRVVRCRLNVG